MLVLDNERLRLSILPEAGAAFARFDALRADGTVIPVFRPAPDGATGPDSMACYPLLPWSNRIRDGFSWNGERFVLARNVPGQRYPLHGDGWQRGWTVRSVSTSAAVLTLESAHQPPFDYMATMRCMLHAGELEVTMSIMHRGQRPAPYGLGLHPWFPRTPDTLVYAPAMGVIGEAADHLPTDWSPIETQSAWDFRAPRPLPQRWINNLFTGWTGCATIDWPSSGLRLAIETAPALPYYIIYSPSSDAPFFCFEPVSHTVDAHNQPDPARWGLRSLAAGESMHMTWRFRPDVELFARRSEASACQSDA